MTHDLRQAAQMAREALENAQGTLEVACYARLIEGLPLSAYGAMGNKTYKWAQGEK